ncbi:hypothetical protein BHE74_00002912 [Ensete ventricosum]|nr:hypothetical protein BHE74_00002912 [Ensete ventricosum]
MGVTTLLPNRDHTAKEADDQTSSMHRDNSAIPIPQQVSVHTYSASWLVYANFSLDQFIPTRPLGQSMPTSASTNPFLAEVDWTQSTQFKVPGRSTNLVHRSRTSGRCQQDRSTVRSSFEEHDDIRL